MTPLTWNHDILSQHRATEPASLQLSAPSFIHPVTQSSTPGPKHCPKITPGVLFPWEEAVPLGESITQSNTFLPGTHSAIFKLHVWIGKESNVCCKEQSCTNHFPSTIYLAAPSSSSSAALTESLPAPRSLYTPRCTPGPVFAQKHHAWSALLFLFFSPNRTERTTSMIKTPRYVPKLLKPCMQSLKNPEIFYLEKVILPEFPHKGRALSWKWWLSFLSSLKQTKFLTEVQSHFEKWTFLRCSFFGNDPVKITR